MIVHTPRKKGSPRAERGAAIDTRPLYIAPGADTYVSLDGPALCISREERAPQLFPLQRLSRVVTATNVGWSSPALLACAERGISVLFLDEQGEIRARLTGRPGAYDELYQRLTEFLLLPQAEGMYGYWFRNYRRRAAHWVGHKLAIPLEQRDPSNCRAQIELRAGRYAGPAVALSTRQWIRSLAFGWMQEHLQDLGLGAGQSLGQIGPPTLARDLAEILIWYLEPARLGWLRSRQMAARSHGEPVRPPTRREVVSLFESRHIRVAERGREITSTLHRWLIHET
ncbi:CRISPR-associated endonuclease Cas1 [Thioalkalicoccus limnaeus]|uniref:CRISPR-associated endonuclease Cas1 n=1 Tax=Thioalkalicoccus limnaeus TaxID=120681 RepID=A0ABV4BGG9_9GAMM